MDHVHQALDAHISKLHKRLDTHRQAFVITFRPACGFDCHQLAAPFLEFSGSYSVISDSVSLIHSHVSLVDQLLRDNPDKISEYLPLLSQFKIEAGVERMATADGGCVSPSYKTKANAEAVLEPSKSTKLMVLVAPLSEDEIVTFLRSLKKMQRHETKSNFGPDYGASNVGDQVVFSFDSSDLVPGVRRYMAIRIPSCHHTAIIGRMLSELNEILWVEPLYDAYTSNRWLKGVCQTGNYENAPFGPVGNLTGDDEIVGIADTGIDMNSCYFYDPNYPIPYNKINLAARKVRILKTHCCDVNANACPSALCFAFIFVLFSFSLSTLPHSPPPLPQSQRYSSPFGLTLLPSSPLAPHAISNR